jgi:hypothetical protein
LGTADLGAAFPIVTLPDIVNHQDPGVRGAAVLCLGHLARIHGRIPTEPTVPIIKKAMLDAEAWVRGRAEIAISDLDVYVPDVARQIQRPDAKAD